MQIAHIQEAMAKRYTKRKETMRVWFLALVAALLSSAGTSFAQTTDTIPPSPPIGLYATAATCGQVDLSWGASTDTGGSGLMAYSIWRSDGGVNTVTTIGAARTTFSDTNYVKSSTTMTYYVVAIDGAGNQSLASNSVTVVTPSCAMSGGEQIVDSAYMEPLGKSMATYGTRSVLLYVKLNPLNLTWDTWLYVNDSDTGQTSRFLLHSSPGYYQIETDYVLTSATELWTLSCDASLSGKLLVSQYQLNGSPPTSATLLSTQSLGDSISYAQSMIRLQSGGLMVAWDEQANFYSSYDLTTGFAYRSLTGVWSVKYPVTVPNSGAGGNITRSRMILAQHPADGSIWGFVKRDSFTDISALHFTEAANDFSIDWINSLYITQNIDGDNGPEGEFPPLAAVPDPTRNAILLAYQSRPYQFVFIDPLYGSMNSIFLKQAYATIAQISADGSKTFIPFQTYMERASRFGMSVLSDGTLWLAYLPINSQTLTWNEVYASKYQNGVWSAPVLTGRNYNNYNQSSGLSDALIYRTDQPQVAFLAPDQKIHTFDLSNLGPAPADTTAPTASVTSPANGVTVSGNVTVSASASDNVGVTRVEFLLDASVVGTATSSPYSFPWNTTTVANGTHMLQTTAYDAAGNFGLSAAVTVTVSNQVASSLAVTITTPKNGGNVPRNQKVTINAAATDTVAVTKVEFYVDDSLLGTATTAPYNYPWKVPAKPGASHKIQAKAYDAAGKSAAQTITVTAQ
jgi:hypothetical protein